MWEYITIKFIDGHVVSIYVGKIRFGKFHYNEMGFEDIRTSSPNKSWKFLEKLADNHGELPPDILKSNHNRTKTKQRLSVTLKECFGIPDDPFMPYSEEKTYKTRFNIEWN